MVIKTDLTLFLFEFLPVYIGKYNKIDFLDNKCSDWLTYGTTDQPINRRTWGMMEWNNH